MFLVVLLLLHMEMFIMKLSSSRIFSRSFPLLFPSYSQPKASAAAEESSLPLTSQIVNPSQEGVLCRKYVANLKREITINKEI